jgi:glycosyltransferase involved in cell wall biosynthesis
MNENIKISIITPSFNQGEFIEQTIQSVLNQTYKNIEYIIVDGGSTDCTLEIINRYRNKIDIIISEKDKGQSDAINKGFKLATGELMGWINSDDLLYPDCVEKSVELYNQYPDASIYYPAILDFIDHKGKILYNCTRKIPDRNYLLNTNYSVIQQGSFYNRHLVEKIGYLDESIYFCMDLDLWLRLLGYAPIYYYDRKPLSAFRTWEETKTSMGGIHFVNDMKRILKRNGAKWYAKTQIRLSYIRCCITGSRIKRFFKNSL